MKNMAIFKSIFFTILFLQYFTYFPHYIINFIFQILIFKAPNNLFLFYLYLNDELSISFPLRLFIFFDSYLSFYLILSLCFITKVVNLIIVQY